MHTTFAKTAALLLLATPYPALSQAPAGQPLSAKVQETLMGPRVSGGRGPLAYLSEDGNHLAIVAPKGSRQVVWLDGVEGPVFDEIPVNFGWRGTVVTAALIVFSPTGGRSAYVARRAGDFIAVVDGKEAVTLSTMETQRALSGTDPAGWTFLFNRDGSRLAYAAQTAAGWVMVADGVKGTPFVALALRQAALNGKRLVYVAQTPDQKWHAVVDGKAGPGYDEVSEMALTPDGAHYAYIATRRAAGTFAELVVVDGVEGPAERDVSDLDLAPDGRVAYMAMKPPTGSGGNPPHLIVAGMDIPWTTTFNIAAPGVGRLGVRAPHLAWSPDGKRFACVQNNHPNPGVTVLVNGKPMGPAYRSASELAWSPDGSRLAYQAVSESGTFLVLDGEESSGYNWIKEFQWSPDGKRYAYSAGTPTAISMIVDGKTQPASLGNSAGSLRFSPDGKHVAFGAQATVSSFQPMVDGVLKPHNLGNFATRVQGNLPIAIPQLLYSPDGNRLAYVGGKTDGTGKISVWVDGVAHPGPLAPAYFHPSWSPDSKHLAVVVSHGSGSGWAIMIDGKLGPNFEDILVLNGASASFVTPTTYRYYTFKGSEIYRVTLELGS